MCYNTLHKIVPNITAEPLAFSFITNNFGYVDKQPYYNESDIKLFNIVENQQQRHENPINEKVYLQNNTQCYKNYEELSMNMEVSEFIRKKSHSNRMQYNIKETITHALNLINEKTNANVHHTLKEFATNSNALIQHLKNIKSKILHDATTPSQSTNTIMEKANTFNTMRFEIEYSFTKIENLEKWIEADPTFEKQNSSVIKFLLSKDLNIDNNCTITNDDNNDDCNNKDNENEEEETEKEGNNIKRETRLYAIGGEKRTKKTNSKWTNFITINILELINFLTSINEQIMKNIINKNLPNVNDAILIYVNQEKLEYIIKGKEKCNERIINKLLREESLNGFNDDDNITFWKNNIEKLIENKEITLFDIKYSKSGLMTINNFQKINAQIFLIILNLLKNAEIENVNTSTEEMKIQHFINYLFKGHILNALKIAKLTTTFSQTNNKTLNYLNKTVEKLSSKNFLNEQKKQN